MQSQYMILIVDDEEKIRKSLSGLLQDYGYEAASAGSGSECFQKMSSQRFTLIILDIVMPVMSGIEVLQRIKEEYKDTEVIIIPAMRIKRRLSPPYGLVFMILLKGLLNQKRY